MSGYQIATDAEVRDLFQNPGKYQWDNIRPLTRADMRDPLLRHMADDAFVGRLRELGYWERLEREHRAEYFAVIEGEHTLAGPFLLRDEADTALLGFPGARVMTGRHETYP